MCGFTQKDVLTFGMLCHTVMLSVSQNMGNYSVLVYRESDIKNQKRFSINELKGVLKRTTIETDSYDDIKECGLDIRIPLCLIEVGECVLNNESSPLNITKSSAVKLQIFINENLNILNNKSFANTSMHGKDEKPTNTEIWCYGLGSVAFISLSGLFGGLFVPLMNTRFYPALMRILLGLAVGSLASTSTLQLIPEGFQLTKYTEDYLNISVCMLGSIWILFLFEVTSSIIIFYNGKGRQNSSPEGTSLRGDDNNEDVSVLRRSSNSLNVIRRSRNSLNSNTALKMAPVAIMILFGDGLHNFIDGMSVGAAYSKGLDVGVSLSIAIACEEYPHELGDFAILINSGLPIRRALLFNFLSACTIFAGFVVGVLIGDLNVNFIFAFAGGLFLYVSLTDILPELTAMINEDLKTSRQAAFKTLILQNVGIATGVSILYTITRFPISI